MGNWKGGLRGSWEERRVKTQESVSVLRDWMRGRGRANTSQKIHSACQSSGNEEIASSTSFFSFGTRSVSPSTSTFSPSSLPDLNSRLTQPIALGSFKYLVDFFNPTRGRLHHPSSDHRRLQLPAAHLGRIQPGLQDPWTRLSHLRSSNTFLNPHMRPNRGGLFPHPAGASPSSCLSPQELRPTLFVARHHRPDDDQ